MWDPPRARARRSTRKISTLALLCLFKRNKKPGTTLELPEGYVDTWHAKYAILVPTAIYFDLVLSRCRQHLVLPENKFGVEVLDALYLREYEYDNAKLTGRNAVASVTSITRGGQEGVPVGTTLCTVTLIEAWLAGQEQTVYITTGKEYLLFDRPVAAKAPTT